MKLSVAICTFQGARFLEKQLTSIREGSRTPDEVVVADDGSTDETVAILDRLAASAPFSVRVIRNEQRLGLAKNFEQAIAACTGDVIVLADQDDIWRRDKLAVIELAFAADPTLTCVFTNARQIDEQDQPIGGSLWDHIGFTAAERRRVKSGRALDVFAVRNVATGATMAFRSAVRSRVLPIPVVEGMIHDGWIALVLAASSRIGCIDDMMIDYRQHTHQQMGAGPEVGGVAQWVGFARTTGRAHFALRAAHLELVLTRLRTVPDVAADSIKSLEGRIAHLLVRATLPAASRHRLLHVLKELVTLRYHRYSRHFVSAAKDLFWNVE